jgi:hypothetical protein
MEKVSWTDFMRSEEILQRVKRERNIKQAIERTKANWIGQIVRRNSLLKHIERNIGGRIEVTGRRKRRRKQLLEDPKETEGCRRSDSVNSSLWRGR